jgi:hypothetical protein
MNAADKTPPALRRSAARLTPLAMLLVAGAAHAQIIQGTLELQWGDPRPVTAMLKNGPRPAAKLLTTLVADDGKRYRLDSAQSLRAADNLYALANRRVAIELSGGAQPTVEAIVSAEHFDTAKSLGDLRRDVSLAAVITGTTRWVTVACKFPEIATEQKPISFFQGQYGTTPGQLGHYWPEVSYGKINLTGSNAYGWFTLPQPRSFYVTTGTDGKEDADLDQLFKDCAAAADPTVAFTGAQGINMMFNGDLDGFAWGGNACGVLDGVNKCIRNTWNPPWSFGNLAPLSHEMGHGYGLPHSDNSDGDSDTYDNPWDVMSDAWSNAVNSPTYGSLPKHINVFQRDRLGWIDAPRKLTVATGGSADHVQLDTAGTPGSSNLQMIVLPMSPADSGGKTMYVVEARVRGGTYENRLAGDAVIIHGINAGGVAYSMDADVPPANRSNNEGSMFKAGETWTSPNGLQRVKVESITLDAQTGLPTGFVVTIGWPTPSTPLAALTAVISRAAPRLPMSAEMRWTGGAARVDVFRNGQLAATIDNAGVYVEKYTGGARPAYRVCNANSATCSATVLAQPIRESSPVPAIPGVPAPKPSALPEAEPSVQALRRPVDRTALD